MAGRRTLTPPAPEPLAARRERALAALRSRARPDRIAELARVGLTGRHRLGLAIPALRALAREFGDEFGDDSGRDHALATALWDTGLADAQLLAGMLADPAQLDAAQMDRWIAGLRDWDVCDQACLNAFVHSPAAWDRIPDWATRSPEFEKRAGFALLAVAAVHHRQRPHADFLARLPLIEAAADDGRNFVKKAVSWALRQIGKRDPALRAPARAVAERLRARDAAAARWIGNQALRELS